MNIKKRKEPETSSSIVLENIPKGLQILPTDSEKTRQSKKKRIKTLRSETKKIQKEEETNSRKQNWQSFVAKGNK